MLQHLSALPLFKPTYGLTNTNTPHSKLHLVGSLSLLFITLTQTLLIYLTQYKTLSTSSLTSLVLNNLSSLVTGIWILPKIDLIKHYQRLKNTSSLSTLGESLPWTIPNHASTMLLPMPQTPATSTQPTNGHSLSLIIVLYTSPRHCLQSKLLPKLNLQSTLSRRKHKNLTSKDQLLYSFPIQLSLILFNPPFLVKLKTRPSTDIETLMMTQTLLKCGELSTLTSQPEYLLLKKYNQHASLWSTKVTGPPNHLHGKLIELKSSSFNVFSNISSILKNSTTHFLTFQHLTMLSNPSQKQFIIWSSQTYRPQTHISNSLSYWTTINLL